MYINCFYNFYNIFLGVSIERAKLKTYFHFELQNANTIFTSSLNKYKRFFENYAYNWRDIKTNFLRKMEIDVYWDGIRNCAFVN